jgi:drug/metabolite transporter (DMT)-like permease
MAPFVAPAASRALAAVLILVASAAIAATTALAKALGTDALGPPLHPLQVAQGRFLFAFLGIAAAVILLRPAPGRVHWRLHLARTSCGATGVTLMFAAAAQIPLSDATAITFLNPVIAMLLAIPLLGERVGLPRWSAAGIALCGAVILLRPGAGVLETGALLAFGAAAAMGLEMIFIKRLAGRERPLQVLFVNNALGLTLSTLAALWVWLAPTAAQWGALAALGLLMAAAQACYINAMARAEASFVAPLGFATLVFATAYDAAWFGAWPDRVSMLGAAVILTGAGMLAWREAVREARHTGDQGFRR